MRLFIAIFASYAAAHQEFMAQHYWQGLGFFVLSFIGSIVMLGKEQPR